MQRKDKPWINFKCFGLQKLFIFTLDPCIDENVVVEYEKLHCADYKEKQINKRKKTKYNSNTQNAPLRNTRAAKEKSKCKISTLTNSIEQK